MKEGRERRPRLPVARRTEETEKNRAARVGACHPLLFLYFLSLPRFPRNIRTHTHTRVALRHTHTPQHTTLNHTTSSLCRENKASGVVDVVEWQKLRTNRVVYEDSSFFFPSQKNLGTERAEPSERGDER